MAVYKDNATGTWRVIYRFTNWKGERKQTQKRGFATKREAQAWEHEAMLKQGAKLDMTFGSFFEVSLKRCPHTVCGKRYQFPLAVFVPWKVLFALVPLSLGLLGCLTPWRS